MQFSEAYVEHSSKHKDYFPIYDNIFSNIDRKKSYMLTIDSDQILDIIIKNKLL